MVAPIWLDVDAPCEASKDADTHLDVEVTTSAQSDLDQHEMFGIVPRLRSENRLMDCLYSVWIAANIERLEKQLLV